VMMAALSSGARGEVCYACVRSTVVLCGQIGPVLRWRIRQHRRLHGSMLTDVAVHCGCPCCALIQENRELYGFEGSHVGEQLPLHAEISRE